MLNNAHSPQIFLELQLLNAHGRALLSQFLSSGGTSLSRLGVFPPAQPTKAISHTQCRFFFFKGSSVTTHRADYNFL